MDLHREFVKLSFDIIRMKNKLISLLLEIYEKEIYRDHGCRTIKEYGFKYAKLSGDVVEKALRTLKHVEDKPYLKRMIETQGIHKVAMVATLATVETDKMFAQHVENMSKPALFEFAKELRHGKKSEESRQQNEMLNLFCERSNDEQQSEYQDKPLVQKCQAARQKMTIELDEELQILFLRLKNKYAKDFSNKEALKLLLQKLVEYSDTTKKVSIVKEKDVPGNGKQKRQKTAETKRKNEIKSENEIVLQAEGQKVEKINPNTEPPESTNFPTRYIPAKQKREILAKYHNKCAYPNCVKPAENLHHRTAFGFEQNHESVIPLCEIHHQFTHNGIIKHELKEPEKWQLNIAGTKTFYDNLYIKYRNPK